MSDGVGSTGTSMSGAELSPRRHVDLIHVSAQHITNSVPLSSVRQNRRPCPITRPTSASPAQQTKPKLENRILCVVGAAPDSSLEPRPQAHLHPHTLINSSPFRTQHCMRPRPPLAKSWRSSIRYPAPVSRNSRLPSSADKPSELQERNRALGGMLLGRVRRLCPKERECPQRAQSRLGRLDGARLKTTYVRKIRPPKTRVHRWVVRGSPDNTIR
ncbi:hypothetical protein R3P38DRAFT_3362563 [Favolaschia claudopus]|uniref:Uncharacterized protein n=1 Tax=Favolaschia claudopus TaxID=2862362 RepID=A0AAW0AN38_9AGAR